MSSCRPPLRVLLLFLVPLAGLFLPTSCFYFCVVLLRIRGSCDFEFENSAQQQPVWSHVFVVFLYFEFISRLDALHSVLKQFVPAHLANEQATSVKQILFCGVMTPTLLPVRPGLHSTDVGLLGVCHCHCHCPVLSPCLVVSCVQGWLRVRVAVPGASWCEARLFASAVCRLSALPEECGSDWATQPEIC